MATYRPNYTEQQVRSNYTDRYQRNSRWAMEKIFNTGPYIVALVSFIIALTSIICFSIVDIVAGKYVGQYLSSQVPRFDWYWTFGTTGIPLTMIGTYFYGRREGWSGAWLFSILLVASVPMGIDCYFDAMSADVIRFGHFINVVGELALVDQIPHQLFRVTLAMMSLVGEPLAAASIIIFPTLREIFRGVFIL